MAAAHKNSKKHLTFQSLYPTLPMAGTLAEPTLSANSTLEALGEGTAATGSILEVTAPAGASWGWPKPTGLQWPGFRAKQREDGKDAEVHP